MFILLAKGTEPVWKLVGRAKVYAWPALVPDPQMQMVLKLHSQSRRCQSYRRRLSLQTRDDTMASSTEGSPVEAESPRLCCGVKWMDIKRTFEGLGLDIY
jgi:hypothetical protein